MKKHYVILWATLIFAALLVATPRYLLFYDAPEYIAIVANNSFFEVFSKGHQPLHPIFLASLWLTTHIFKIFNLTWEHSGNLSSFLWGTLAAFTFFKLTKFFFKDKNLRFLTTLIFLFSPSVWIISSNLMVESFLLLLFVLSTYLFLAWYESKTKLSLFLYILSISLLIGSHIESLFWLPSHIALVLFFEQRISYPSIAKWLTAYFVGVLMGLFFYFVVFALDGRDVLSSFEVLMFGRVSEHFDLAGLVGFTRMGRNAVLTWMRGFGTLSLVFSIYYLLKDRGHKAAYGWIILFLLAFINGAVWTGDFMPRRLVFLAVPLSLLYTSYLGKKALLVYIYLVPIVLANALLYSSGKNLFYLKLRRLHEKIPKGEVLIQTPYLRPFTHYGGDILWLGVDNLEVIDKQLSEGKRIFLDSQAVTAPYKLIVGENYHITSFGTPKRLPIDKILKNKYSFKPTYIEDEKEGVFVYEIQKIENGPVFELDLGKNYQLRRRVDYGDIITQLWITGLNLKSKVEDVP